ncbi:MarR family winged helix-turn-helix transcriptional regulator [Reyranella sp.]|jgi:DNA-binding MarR family transcriptional regulator|uniref:MarR family winged helix-turn-helix transcriptional regulator n=1 Tax=Reyranella sp. TaxID=1929291 RepID=UPI003F6E87A7
MAASQEARAVAPVLDLSYLEGTIGYAIRRAQLLIFADIYRVFGEDAVTTAQFSVLAVVADNPGANQADLALALGVERPRMVPLIDALEERGLLVRIPSVVDRRHRHIQLTTEGERLLSKLKQRFSAHQQRLIDVLGASEAKRFLRSLRLLATAMA